MVEIAIENTDRLVRLINDILDIERIESGRVTMHKVACRSDDLVAQAIEAVQAAAEATGIGVVSAVERVLLWADPDRIMQTLTNLLSNAVKFSPRGEEVRVRPAPTADDGAVQVVDQGRGIPADKLESIFERFHQVDASDSREKGGTGLGLPISRSIVEQHGGRIWAESDPGRGATFSFTLPAVPRAAARPRTTTACWLS